MKIFIKDVSLAKKETIKFWNSPGYKTFLKDIIQHWNRYASTFDSADITFSFVRWRHGIQCENHKHATLFSALTPVFLGQLLCLLYQWKQEWILYGLLTYKLGEIITASHSHVMFIHMKFYFLNGTSQNETYWDLNVKFWSKACGDKDFFLPNADKSIPSCRKNWKDEYWTESDWRCFRGCAAVMGARRIFFQGRGQIHAKKLKTFRHLQVFTMVWYGMVWYGKCEFI